uniref:Uncharacterized protein n=1 Tax=Sphaerodactylus townsendi TaxID=933632 RepID=A0ACB8EJA4_9SAUR
MHHILLANQPNLVAMGHRNYKENKSYSERPPNPGPRVRQKTTWKLEAIVENNATPADFPRKATRQLWRVDTLEPGRQAPRPADSADEEGRNADRHQKERRRLN